MAATVIRLARYTRAGRDEITGGAVDPSGVAATGLAWLDKEVHFGVRRQRRLVAHAGWVRVALSVGAVRLQVAGLGVVVAPGLSGQGPARLVVTAAMDPACGLGVERGLLLCRPEFIALYGRLGWKVLPGDVLVQQPGGLVRMPLRAMWTPFAGGAEWPAGPARLLSLPM
ncbi:GNAT family N-acetyltransferase [Streptomyces sp. NPDC091215]|uniref:GNAT family N-acetyltransferase n=1 Tax=Streptomyces sp. NPDC091215 TaxID=3155192 RepID=UPI00342F1D5D